ncbi:MAG: hypothetical protein QM777_08865 [Pseudorhodoferax sp.]
MTTSTLNGKTQTTGIAASAILGGLAAIIFAIVWAGFWSGLAVSVLWGWFVVPLFGLPALSIAQAYGIALLVGLLTHQESKADKDEDGFAMVLGEAFLRAPFTAGLVLLISYVVKLWT